jgi:hypothetical protein
MMDMQKELPGMIMMKVEMCNNKLKVPEYFNRF